MSHPPKRADHRPSAAVAHAAHPRLSAARRAWRLCVRTVLVLVLLLCSLLVYLNYVGVPGWALARWIRHQEARHRYLDIGRMRFNVFEGVVAHNVAYYETPQRALPMLEADRVDLTIRVTAWLQAQSGWRGILVEKGTVRLAPGGSLLQADPDHILTASALYGRFTWADDLVVVEAMRGEALGFRFNGQGRVDLSRRARTDVPGIPPADGSPRSPSSRWLDEVVAQLNQVEFEQLPDVEVHFDIQPWDLARSSFRIKGHGSSTLIRGVHFDQWNLVGGFDHSVLKLEDLSARHDQQALRVTGTYRLDRDEIAGSVECGLPPAHWRSLMPVAWRDRMEESGFIFSGPVTANVTFGPVPHDKLLSRISGTIDAEKAEIRGLWLERFRTGFVADADALHLMDMDARVGTDGEHGTLQGNLDWQYADRRYAGAFRSQLDFAGLAPILNEKQLRTARSLQVEDRPLSATIRFEGRQGDVTAFRANGTVIGTNVFYRGAHINRGHTLLTLSNRVVQLDNLHVERDEGMLDGRIRLDSDKKVLTLDMAGTVGGKAVARVSGPSVERALRIFEFGGPLTGSVQGNVHFADKENTRLQIHAAGDAVSLRAYQSTHLSADILWTNNVIDVQAFQADIYDGTVTGAYTIITRGPDTPARYRLQGTADRLIFEDVVRTMAHREGEPYRGRISGRLALDGLLGAGHGAQATGQGSIVIERGRIMRIPIFGGLSRGLSKIYSGLGFAKQTDFSADFEIRELYLHSTNVQLEGDVFSLHGEGKYGIVPKTVDFVVEFKLLRDGSVGKVIRLVTLPITKLLRFDLEGTLEEPEWRPKNLPNELLDIFD